MNTSTFTYVTFIRTTPERLWQALTEPDFVRQYWFGVEVRSDWQIGSDWQLAFGDGRVADTGQLIEVDPPRRMVIRWRNEFRPELKAEGYSLCTLELAPVGETVKLTITHTMDREASKFIGAVSTGWPSILSNLKSLLETGTVLRMN
jgi:uncharacterized protein YndB with AHSA1/START domain